MPDYKNDGIENHISVIPQAAMVTVSEGVEHFNFVSGVSLNLLLLYAIRRYTRQAIGTYKHLLTVFASYDVFLSVSHAAVKPRAIIINTTFGMSSLTESREITACYCSCVTVPFALMIIHFLYRFWSIRYPHLIYLFSNKRFVTFITSSIVLLFLLWCRFAYYGTAEGPEKSKRLLSAEYERRFGKELKEGWLIFNYWKDGVFQLEPFLTVLGTDLLMVCSFTIAITLASLTFYHIKRAEKISIQSNRLQRKLFVALCAQTFVPFVFVYLPSLCVVNLGCFGLPIFSMDDTFTILVSCFPAWDAVVIILLMSDYRNGVRGMFRKNTAHAQKETTWMTATSIPNMLKFSAVAVPQVS